VYKPRIQKVRNINGTKLIATSRFKIQENLLAIDLMIQYMHCKAFEALIEIVGINLNTTVHSHFTFFHFIILLG